MELYLHSPNTHSWRGAWLSTGTTLPLPFTFAVTMVAMVHQCGGCKGQVCWWLLLMMLIQRDAVNNTGDIMMCGSSKGKVVPVLN
jgi:hypothetical protein